MLIRPFDRTDESAVVTLWDQCGLLRPWNDPHKDIQRKLAVCPEQFLVGTEGEKIISTAMVGYDGHRGWIYYFAVAPEFQKQGHGRKMIAAAEQLLRGLGCPKINLQVRSKNRSAIEFYRRIGFIEDEVLSFGKRLEVDGPQSSEPRTH